MLIFIAKTKQEAYQKIDNCDWVFEAIYYLKKFRMKDSNDYAISLGVALELFEVSLDDEYIDYNQISFGDTPFTNKCKEMITNAYYLAIGSFNVNVDKDKEKYPNTGEFNIHSMIELDHILEEDEF